MPLPERIWLPLSEAADLIRKTCECSVESAREALTGALRDGQIDARGTRPSRVYERAKASGGLQGSDLELRRAFPPKVGCRLNSSFFLSHDIDWQTNNVGEATDVEVNRKSLLQWLGEGEPVAEGTEAVPEGADVGSVEADPYRTGAEGRPSVAHFVKTEFERRIGEDNLVKPTLAEEARVLEKWVTLKYPDGPPMTAHTIENRIRTRYNEIRKNPTK